MKTLIIFLMLMLGITTQASINNKPFVIPELQSWTGREGTITPRRIVTESRKLMPVAQALSDDYKQLYGLTLPVIKGKGQTGDIVLQQGRLYGTHPESYHISLKKKIVITAATRTGIYWATRTLLQMSETARSLPQGEIQDQPEYALRGFMIDCGRKFIPMSYLQDLVKIMAYYKMNTLHVHLNDNGFKQFFGNDWNRTQGAFRLECETFPGLTAKDGYYTKNEFRQLQRMAEKCEVQIIPEIDIPAHSLAFTHYRPSLASKKYGMDHLDLTNPATIPFCDSLFHEYLSGKDPVFRGSRIHIGTDEYSNRDQEVVELFRAFTQHYIDLIKSYGKQPALWGALTRAKGTTPVAHDNVLMYCWAKSFADPIAMRKEGFQLVSIPDRLVYIVPSTGYYHDYLDLQQLYEHYTPANMGSAQLEENDPQIEGGMAAVWNDHVGNGITVSDIHHRLMPALQLMASKCWSGARPLIPYGQWNTKRQTLHEAPGVNQLARHGKPHSIILQMDEVPACHSLEGKDSLGHAINAIGYDYSISFDIDCRPETTSTILMFSGNSRFYLAAPQTGLLGYEREGCLNTFNYHLPNHGKVNLRIEGNNKMTRLWINGRLHQTLGAQTVYSVNTSHLHQPYTDTVQWKPEVYVPGAAMYYQRTLVFPLEKTGDFKSIITNFKVKNYIEE